MCEGKTARDSAIYPFKLCKAILQGFRNQLRDDELLTIGVAGMQHPQNATDDQLRKKIGRIYGIAMGEEFAEDGEDLMKLQAQGGRVIKDAITGQALNPELVREARREELEYFAAKHVWFKRSRSRRGVLPSPSSGWTSIKGMI